MGNKSSKNLNYTFTRKRRKTPNDGRFGSEKRKAKLKCKENSIIKFEENLPELKILDENIECTMATRINTKYPPSPTNNESDCEELDEPVDDDFEDDTYDTKTNNNGNGFADILKRLQSAGALLKKPKKEYCCKTCDQDFVDWEDLENHLYQHVSLPSVVLERLPSDDEDPVDTDDENWSDDEELQLPLKREGNKTPQKVNISQILNKTGLTIKKSDTGKSSEAALNKLSNLGFTIKKSSTPIKKEEQNEQNDSQINKKVGNIRLKLKSDGNKLNTFTVVNGLKGFRPSDDDDDESDHEGGNDDESGDDKSKNKNQEDDEDFEGDSDDEQLVNISRRSSDNSESSKNDLQNQMKKFQGKQIKMEPIKIQKGQISKTIVKQLPSNIVVKSDSSIEQSKEVPKKETPMPKPSGRPSVKQTPKRGPNNPLPNKSQHLQQLSNSPSPTKEVQKTPERRESHEVNTENVVVKQEIYDSTETESKNVPLLSKEIKSERTSPPLDRAPTPIIAKIKTEPGVSNVTTATNSSLLPVTKTEDSVTIIEINGDSNDEDDDCCVVSSTPAPDVKPILSDVSEYISLDTLGPKHTCEVCNTRFTDISLFEEHKRMTGHSNSLVLPSSSTLVPYNPASNLLSSLLPGKLAEQVGKLSTIGNSGPGFTHQQNVMINIQAYPGAGGVMQTPQPYNAYAPQGHNQQGGYAQSPNNMYTSTPGQPLPGQYPGSAYQQNPGYGQYPTAMSTPGYPTAMSTNVYSSASSPYSSASPLQSMQQAVYGQSATGMMNPPPVTMMGPPGSAPNQPYSSAPSPNAMKQSSSIRIQNVQTFPPGHIGQTINPGQTATAGQQHGSNQQPMKTVNKEANAMANVLASRGISVKQKQKSRSPSPPRALPNLPNIPGVSIKHSSGASNFSIPEAKIGGGMLSCKICKKMFMSSTSLSVHMSNAHPQSKVPSFKCDECPASYPKSLQLQHHKRVFHNVTGPGREMGLPVVDLSQEENLQRLSDLGIYNFIPLANREQGNGCFGIPVISVHNVQNGLTSGLQALGADGLLSLGPLKPLPNS
ncbi:PREDICTED: uncharacterized protein LOC106111721 [Papilio polytes]|uniref:uncharacterized protein LOC106111721 n=1 Tax=Papilio polytes TaxID=76194 RepID=UPI000675C0AC|nr:PREDICTED: uncharacterized protein LOC106111721 [Papilio polytes]